MQNIPGNLISFNVSGQVYETTLSTLHNFPNGLLSTLVKNVSNQSLPIFIDRDPQLFRWILFRHRDPSISISAKTVQVTQEIWDAELDYFGVAFPAVTEEEEHDADGEVGQLQKDLRALKKRKIKLSNHLMGKSRALFDTFRQKNFLAREVAVTNFDIQCATFLEYLLDAYENERQSDFDFISLDMAGVCRDERVKTISALIFCSANRDNVRAYCRGFGIDVGYMHIKSNTRTTIYHHKPSSLLTGAKKMHDHVFVHLSILEM